MSAATDASGTQKYWSDGLPFVGVNKTGNDNGTLKFWSDGLPGRAIFAPTAGGPVVNSRFFFFS